jgi:hypothetical protein
VTTLSLKRRCHEQAFSWLPCKLCLTPCAENLTVGSLLTGWQLSRLQTCLELCRFAQAVLKPGFAWWKVSLPTGMAREPNYNILSEQMAYYSRYATIKKGVMLGFSLLQLVTSKPGAVAIPESQPTQSLSCSSHVLATQHSIASMHPTPTRPFCLYLTSWRALEVREEFLSCLSRLGCWHWSSYTHLSSLGQLSVRHCWPCTEARLCSEVSTIGRCSCNTPCYGKP